MSKWNTTPHEIFMYWNKCPKKTSTIDWNMWDRKKKTLGLEDKTEKLDHRIKENVKATNTQPWAEYVKNLGH